MLKYKVNQPHVEKPPLRTAGANIIVYDRLGTSFIVSLSQSGNLQISTLEGEILVMPQCSNSIIVKTDE